jgi:hypothetical protein
MPDSSQPTVSVVSPKTIVSGSQPRLRTTPFQNGQLLPERQVFHEQLAARAEESDD